MILHAEHGSNASSFAARVTIGTKAKIYDAFVTAISTLSGPAHGGAAEDVMKMIDEIGEPENVSNYIKNKRMRKEPITGFGHRVYKKEDPRARFLKIGLKKLSIEKGEPKWFKILENLVLEMKPYARHGLNANVDLYSGAIYNLQKIPIWIAKISISQDSSAHLQDSTHVSILKQLLLLKAKVRIFQQPYFGF